MSERNLPEPWLRGTLTGIPCVHRAVLHALELAAEDLQLWCGSLNDVQLNQRPAGMASLAFHLRHIARSMDRLLTYAEGGALTPNQMAALKSEADPGATHNDVFGELSAALKTSASRIGSLAGANLEASRTVGQKNLPTTLGGILVHVAEHTQRHVGQAITTAKIVAAEAP